MFKKFVLALITAFCLLFFVQSASAVLLNLSNNETNGKILIYSVISYQDLVEFKKIDTKFMKTLEIELNSGGGNADVGVDIFTSLKEMSKQGIKITTKVKGMAGSAAGIIFLAGDIRVAYEGSMIMLHKAFMADRMGNKIKPDIKTVQGKSLKIINDYFIEITKDVFGSKEKAEEALDSEIVITAKKAKELNVATKYINVLN